MIWLVLLVIAAIILIRFRKWFQTTAGRLVIDACGLAIVIALYVMHGAKGSVMYIELLIGLAAIYDGVMQLRQLGAHKK